MAETKGRQISREDKARGFACFVKPIYSSYVDLLNLSLSNSTPSAGPLQDSTHSGYDADPLAELINELDIEHVQWVQIDSIDDNLLFLTPQIEYPTPHTPEDIIIQIPGEPPLLVPQQHEIRVPQDDQILIDAGIPRLMDNPQDVWRVFDPPNSESSQSTRSTHSDQENPENSSSSSSSSSASSVIRDVVPVKIETEQNIRKFLDYRPKRKDPIDYDNMSPLFVGDLPDVTTRDHATNNIIKHGAKIWLPSNVICIKYTPKKNLLCIQRLEKAGVLERVYIKPKHLVLLFCAPKGDPCNP